MKLRRDKGSYESALVPPIALLESEATREGRETMDTVTVTIGRNVGNTPMKAEQWHRFLSDTRKAVESATVELWADGPSKSEWAGHKEENFFFYGPVVSAAAKTYLRTRLETLASYYNQEAIGVSFGESELLHSFSATYNMEESEEDNDIFSAIGSGVFNSDTDSFHDIEYRQELARRYDDGRAV